MVAPQPPWEYPVLKAIADVLADTSDGSRDWRPGPSLEHGCSIPTATRRDQLAETFVGLRGNDEGKVARGTQAQALDEATRIETSIRDELPRRKAHPETLRYCSMEVLRKRTPMPAWWPPRASSIGFKA